MPKYTAIGNEIYDRRGCHVLGINYAPHGDKAKMAKRVARLLCLEDALHGAKDFQQQGIEGIRHGNEHR